MKNRMNFGGTCSYRLCTGPSPWNSKLGLVLEHSPELQTEEMETACPSVFITSSLEANGWTEQYLQSLPKLVSSILLTMLLVPNTSTMVNFMIAPPGSSHKLCLLNFRQWAMAEFPNQWVFKENVCSLFTNSLSMKRSSQKKHLKVKGERRITFVALRISLYWLHSNFPLPEHRTGLKITFVIHSHYKGERNSRSAFLKVPKETF